MKIGIDARPLKIDGGSKVYTLNLLNNLIKKQNFILFGIKKFENFQCLNSKIKSNSIFRLYYENIIIPTLIKNYKIDIFHGTKGAIPITGKVKKILTALDLSFLVFPEYFSKKDKLFWKYIFPIYLRKADKIITISESTKKDLIKYFKINDKKIKTVYLGYSKELFKPKDKGKSYNQVKRLLEKKGIIINNIKEKKIILNVNTIQPRKNISNLIKAFDKMNDKNAILLISGKFGWKYEEIINVYEESLNKNNIHFLGFTEDEELANLYNISSVFIYPSFYEGFGLPPLEAMACGCPVITSNTSSLPEVVGDAGIMVDPNNVREIRKQIELVIKNKKLRKEMIGKGFKQAKKFSWEKTARETLKVLEELGKK